MTENEIRNDFANRLITRLESMQMIGAARVVQLTLDDMNVPDKDDIDTEQDYPEEDDER
jgi:hypothetical protein